LPRPRAPRFQEATGSRFVGLRQGFADVLRRYGVGAAASVLTVLLATALAPAGVSPFPLLLVAVAFSAWYGGLGPGLFATALCTLAIDYYFEEPVQSLAVTSIDTVVELAEFVGTALLISALTEHLHAARARAEAAIARVRELERAQAREALVEERARIAREMHDGLATSLAGLALEAGALASSLQHHGSPAADRVAYLAELARYLTREARALLHDFRVAGEPRTFLDELQGKLASWEETTHIPTHLCSQDVPATITLQLEHELLRIVDEALANTRQHACARTVRVLLTSSAERITLTFQDDGRGFEPPDDWVALGKAGHFGLLGIRERATHLGGDLEVISSPGRGTELRVWVPLARRPPTAPP
jgi:signal transduction histidine kinase